MTKHFYDVHLRHHLILRHVMVRHIIVLLCHVCGIYVFVSSCKCYSRLVNVCHGFVPSWFWYFCHSNAFHAHACHAIVCHAIVTSCKCLSCNRGHVNERPTSASSCVPRWLRLKDICNGQVASAGHPGHLLGTSRQGARLLYLSEVPGEPSVSLGFSLWSLRESNRKSMILMTWNAKS